MLTLVKSTGGTDGLPQTCSCGSVHFLRSGLGWSCTSCSLYVPAKLEKNRPFDALKKNFEALQAHHADLKKMIKELEALVGPK